MCVIEIVLWCIEIVSVDPDDLLVRDQSSVGSECSLYNLYV